MIDAVQLHPYLSCLAHLLELGMEKLPTWKANNKKKSTLKFCFLENSSPVWILKGCYPKPNKNSFKFGISDNIFHS